MPTVAPICATLSEVLATSARTSLLPNTIPAAVTTIPVAANARMTLVRGQQNFLRGCAARKKRDRTHRYQQNKRNRPIPANYRSYRQYVFRNPARWRQPPLNYTMSRCADDCAQQRTAQRQCSYRE